MGYHFSSRLTATLNLCLIYFKTTRALSTLVEHMQKKFEINLTKIKGGCQSGRKVVTHNSKSDLPLVFHFKIPYQYIPTLTLETRMEVIARYVYMFFFI